MRPLSQDPCEESSDAAPERSPILNLQSDRGGRPAVITGSPQAAEVGTFNQTRKAPLSAEAAAGGQAASARSSPPPLTPADVTSACG